MIVTAVDTIAGTTFELALLESVCDGCCATLTLKSKKLLFFALKVETQIKGNQRLLFNDLCKFNLSVLLKHSLEF
jgi:hypothetical protein